MPRSFFVGDVHGCIEELDDLVALLRPSDGDRFFFLGDLVDRGPDSVGVIRRVRELVARHPGSVCISGNHEEQAFRTRLREDNGRAWMPLATADDWAFLDALPLVHHVRELAVVLVHGGFFPRFFEHHGAVGDSPAQWRKGGGKRVDRMRRFLRVRQVNVAGDMVGSRDASPICVHWSSVYDGREGFCFFGHDPQLDPPVPLRAPHATGLDTACCFGGRLTAAVLAGDRRPADAEMVSVPARARYAEPRRMYAED